MKPSSESKLPKVFHKMKARVINELAITWIVESMSDDNEKGVEIPNSWFNEAHRLQEQMLDDINRCREEEITGIAPAADWKKK
jgi:hypothetical protein